MPPARAIRCACTCPDADYSGTCKHAMALAYVVAAAIDEDPWVLLEWRGCAKTPAGPRQAAARPGARGRSLGRRASGPGPRPARPLPVGSVLKRLGASGVVVDGPRPPRCARARLRRFRRQGLTLAVDFRTWVRVILEV